MNSNLNLSDNELLILNERQLTVRDFTSDLEKLITEYENRDFIYYDSVSGSRHIERFTYSPENLDMMEEIMREDIVDQYEQLMIFSWKRILDFFGIETVYTTSINERETLIIKYEGNIVLLDLNREIVKDNGEPDVIRFCDWKRYIDNFYGHLKFNFEYSRHFNLTDPIFYLNLTGGGLFSDEGTIGNDFINEEVSVEDIEYFKGHPKNKKDDGIVFCYFEWELPSKGMFYGFQFLPIKSECNKEVLKDPNRMKVPFRKKNITLNVRDRTREIDDYELFWKLHQQKVILQSFFRIRSFIRKRKGNKRPHPDNINYCIWKFMNEDLKTLKYKTFPMGGKDYSILYENQEEMLILDSKDLNKGFCSGKLVKEDFEGIKELVSKYKSNYELSFPLIMVLNSKGITQFKDNEWRPRIEDYLLKN